MKKKNGFTLIELLAVIVILAIIALIATPIVMNVIDNAKKAAAERSKENYLRAVETAIIASKLDADGIKDDTYIINDDGNLESVSTGKEYVIEMAGDVEKPINGVIVVENKEIVSSDMRDIEVADGKIKMSVMLTKRTDEETGTKYVDLAFSLDEFTDGTVYTGLIGSLKFNNGKLTYDSSSAPYKYKDNLIVVTNINNSNVSKVETFDTLTFITDDLDSISADDFVYYAYATDDTGKSVTVEQNTTSDIEVVNKQTIVNVAVKSSGYDYAPGDVNNDGFVDVTDRALAYKYNLKPNENKGCQAMDVNGDGVVNVKDMVRYSNYLAKKPDTVLQYGSTPIKDSNGNELPGHL